MQCTINSAIRRGLFFSTLKNNCKSILFQNNLAPTRNVTKIPLYDIRGPESHRNCTEHYVTQELHVSSQKTYPATKALPLPNNMEEMDDAEQACFSPQRDRDILDSVMLSKNVGDVGRGYDQQAVYGDPHMGSFDCHSALSLNSVMQTNVPEPFSPTGKSTHLNMPGGQWGQGQKYISEDMQNSHYTKVYNNFETGVGLQGTDQAQFLLRQFMLPIKSMNCAVNAPCLLVSKRTYSSNSAGSGELTRREKLKRAVKEYGSTVVVFHVAISLLSLGGCYLAVTSGMNVTGVLNALGPGSEIAAEAGQFVIAYTVHKLFAPIRISITLASTPFIVRYLRRIGFLKAPKPQP